MASHSYVHREDLSDSYSARTLNCIVVSSTRGACRLLITQLLGNTWSTARALRPQCAHRLRSRARIAGYLARESSATIGRGGVWTYSSSWMVRGSGIAIRLERITNRGVCWTSVTASSSVTGTTARGGDNVDVLVGGAQHLGAGVHPGARDDQGGRGGGHDDRQPQFSHKGRGVLEVCLAESASVAAGCRNGGWGLGVYPDPGWRDDTAARTEAAVHRRQRPVRLLFDQMVGSGGPVCHASTRRRGNYLGFKWSCARSCPRGGVTSN